MKKRLAEALILTLVLAALSTCAQEQAKTDLSFDPSAAHWVSRTLSQMSLEQKIGQMIGLRYTSRFMNQDSAVLEELRRWVVGHHIGGFIQVQGGVFETAALSRIRSPLSRMSRESSPWRQGPRSHSMP